MAMFEDIEDVQDWLAPCDYEGFWDAVAHWSVFTGDERAHYDHVIANGAVCPDLVLSCLKTMARVELQVRFGLKDRSYTAPDAQYLRRTH